jgi:hypothetical protein
MSGWDRPPAAVAAPPAAGAAVATALNASWSDYQPAVGTSYSDRQVTPEEEEEEEEEFVVETVCGARVVEGVMEFRVKWQGYDSDDDTWEPEGNLTNCSEKVEAFVKGKGKAQTPVVSKKHTARTPAAPTHCDNGSVAEYCEVLSAMVECNTAVYHLGAGTNAKAASPTSVT